VRSEKPRVLLGFSWKNPKPNQQNWRMWVFPSLDTYTITTDGSGVQCTRSTTGTVVLQTTETSVCVSTSSRMKRPCVPEIATSLWCMRAKTWVVSASPSPDTGLTVVLEYSSSMYIVHTRILTYRQVRQIEICVSHLASLRSSVFYSTVNLLISTPFAHRFPSITVYNAGKLHSQASVKD